MMLFLKKKIISFIIFGLTVFGLIVVLIICPLINKISDASQKYQLNREILDSFDKREAFAKELKKDFQQKQDSLLKIDGILLTSKETIGFISTLETIAEETGNLFKIEAATPSNLSSEEEPFLSLRATLRGNFSELLYFIAKLEDSPYPPYRLIEIDNLNIKRLTEQNISYLGFDLGEGDLETSVDIKIYVNPTKE